MNSHHFWLDHFKEANSELLNTFLNLSVSDCETIFKELDIKANNGKKLESAENRVFSFDELVIKFYKPQRWSKEAIEEEFVFLKDLQAANVPFVRPVGEVGQWKGLYYILFEKIEDLGIESDAALTKESVRKMVHTVARIHEVGAQRVATHRCTFDPKGMASGCFEVIKRAGYLPKNLEKNYEQILTILVSKFAAFPNIPIQRIHGDTYTGNVIWSPNGPVFIDLDDFQMGPVALDIKLLSFPWRLDTLSADMDKKERRNIQQQMVLDFYREVRDFPKEQEKLFSLLTAYRDVQFDAWFSARWSEPGFAKCYEDDDITDPEWWEDNIEWLEKLLE